MGLLSSYAINQIMHLCVMHLSVVNCMVFRRGTTSLTPQQAALATELRWDTFQAVSASPLAIEW